MLVPGNATIVGDEALVGNVVSERYVVENIVGHGTTGTVFIVHHVAYPRVAMLKLLRPHYASPELVSRVFHGEVRAALGVVHPNMCEVFDIGTLPDGTPFLVMEYLQGETLAARIARERIPVNVAVDITMQLLAALSAIHARALLLRELRPENVFLVERRGCRPLVKVLDFGLARLCPLDRVQDEWVKGQDAGPSAAGRTRIPLYLSPERSRGETAVEQASDLYSIGVLFYEMLTGEVPCARTSYRDVVEWLISGTRPVASERCAEVSPALDAFIARALACSPNDRFGSANDMQDELRGLFQAGGEDESVELAERTIPPQRAPEPTPWSDVPNTPFDASIERAFDIITKDEEEDTETFRMSPNLRARVEQLMTPASPRVDATKPKPQKK